MNGKRSAIVDVAAEEINWLLVFPPEHRVATPKGDVPEIRIAARIPRPAADRRRAAQWFFGFGCVMCATASGMILLTHTAPEEYAGSLPAAPAAMIPAVAPVAATSVPPEAPAVPESVALTATSGLFARSTAGIRDGSERTYLGTLRVESQPSAARVFVNNEYRGETPIVVGPIPAGSRAIRVQLEGYQPWSRGVRVVANQSTIVAARLIPGTIASASRLSVGASADR